MRRKQRGPGRPAKPGGQFGRRLFAARKAAGLTQAELACRLGVSKNTVARWERGERTPRPVMQSAALTELARRTAE